MLPLHQLAMGSLEEAVSYLSERAVQVRNHGLSYREKQAIPMSDVLAGIGEKLKDPVLGKAILGGGLGAAALGGHAALTQDPKKRSNILSRTITGGLAGAAAGGGLGLAHQAGGGGPAIDKAFEWGKSQLPDSWLGKKPPSSTGKYVDPNDGKTYQVHNPEEMKKIERLTGHDFLGGLKFPRVSATALPLGGLYDLATSRGDRSGGFPTAVAGGGKSLQRLGKSMGRVGTPVGWLGNAMSWAGRKMPGIVDPRHAPGDELVRAGLNKALKEPKNLTPGQLAAYNYLVSDEGKPHLQEMARHANPKGHDVPGLKLPKETMTEVQTPSYKPNSMAGASNYVDMPDPADASKTILNPKTKSVSVSREPVTTMEPHTEHIPGETVKNWRTEGLKAIEEDRGLKGQMRTRRGWGGKTKLVAPEGGNIKRWAFYAGLPAAEMLYNDYTHDQDRNAELQTTLKDLIKKKHITEVRPLATGGK